MSSPPSEFRITLPRPIFRFVCKLSTCNSIYLKRDDTFRDDVSTSKIENLPDPRTLGIIVTALFIKRGYPAGNVYVRRVREIYVVARLHVR